MKLKLFIVSMVISISSVAQTKDSIAYIRKPVLEFLIGEHYRAEKLQDISSTIDKKNKELLRIIELKDNIILSLKADSTQAGTLLRLEKSTSSSWEKSYQVEKMEHKQTRKQVKKWKLVTVVVAALAIYGLVN
jgi:hypothetical protein